MAAGGGFIEGEGIEAVGAVGKAVIAIIEDDFDISNGSWKVGADDHFDKFAGITTDVIVVKFVEENSVASSGPRRSRDGAKLDLESLIGGNRYSLNGGA